LYRYPTVSTRAVCKAWLTLRAEVTELLELRKQLAKRQEELVGQAGLYTSSRIQ
jgi:DNA methyltransferase 1-associated protein 1